MPRAIAGAPAMAIVLAGCSASKPVPPKVVWKVGRTADKKAYHLTGGLKYAADAPEGLYTPAVTLVDDRGCRTDFEVPDSLIERANENAAGESVPIDDTVKLKRPVARAEMRIEFSAGVSDSRTPSVVVFSQDKVLDATLHPPAEPMVACHAPLTPDQVLENLPRERQVALAIQSAGFLCHRVIDLYPDSAGEIMARCVLYPSGRGLMTYRIDADAGTVSETE